MLRNPLLSGRMTLVAILFVATSVASTIPSASEIDQAIAGCMNKPTAQQRACLGQYYHQDLDPKFNKVYNDLYAALQKSHAPGYGNVERATLLKQAEQLWIKFRDANCNFSVTETGTAALTEILGCSIKMTGERGRELETELDHAK